VAVELESDSLALALHSDGITEESYTALVPGSWMRIVGLPIGDFWNPLSCETGCRVTDGVVGATPWGFLYDPTYEDSDAGATCGNGALEGGEECDDGNLDNGDGCDQSCHLGR